MTRTLSPEREWDGWVWRPLAGNECMTGSDTYPPEWKGEAGPGWRRVRPVEGRGLLEVECSHLFPCTPTYDCSMHRKGRVRSRPELRKAHTHIFADALLVRPDRQVRALIWGRLVIIWDSK